MSYLGECKLLTLGRRVTFIFCNGYLHMHCVTSGIILWGATPRGRTTSAKLIDVQTEVNLNVINSLNHDRPHGMYNPRLARGERCEVLFAIQKTMWI